MAGSTATGSSQFQRLFSLAVDQFEAGNITGAKATLEDLLEKIPDHPQILNYLAVTTHICGDHVGAEALLIRAVEVEPGFVDAWNNLGLLSLEIGNHKTSANAFEKICYLAPGTSDPIINLAHALHAGGRYNEAIDAYRKGLSIQPKHPSAWTTLCRVLLIEGRWEEAASAADHQISIRPGHTVALAFKSIAFQELGEKEAYKELVDFDRLIGCFKIDVPSSYPDLSTFNSVLSDFCQNHPSLEYTPKTKSTELGFQTKSLTEETESPIADLLTGIRKCVTLYLKERPISSEHPFLSQRPKGRHYDIWATVLESGGHQESHIHRDGWLSGVYYAKTPTGNESNLTASDTAGWIKFGQPVFYPKAKAIPVTRLYPPTEGYLYLFPSYFYHRTVPFFSETRRISIAFDLRDRPLERQALYIDYVDG